MSNVDHYNNNGEWQKIRVKSIVKDNSEFILFTISGTKSVTSPVEIKLLSFGIINNPTHNIIINKVIKNTLDDKFKFNTISFSPNKLIINNENSKPGILVYADSWSADWRVAVDGIYKPLLKTDIGFKGVELESSNLPKIVEFTYSPTLFKYTFYLYLIFIIFFPLIIIYNLLLKKIDNRLYTNK